MGEQQKPEEIKAEEAKIQEKPLAEEEQPKPPSPFTLFVDLHCIGCAQKIEKSLLRIRGVVAVDTDMMKNQVTVKGVVEPDAICNKIMKKTKRSAKVLSPVPATEGEPITQVAASQVLGLATVELNVNMHCEACAQQLRRKIIKMRGVSKVETELSSGKVRVSGSMDGEKLVEYVYRRTKKQAKIVPRPEPEHQKEKEEKGAEDAKKEKNKDEGEDAKPEEKYKGGDCEKVPEEEKKEGGDEKKQRGGGGGGGGDDEEEEYMQQMMMRCYQYQYQHYPLYVMERIPASQLFSDENPNACTIC
ncbi:hypothetical protein L2E82_31512 [Cichorium intybus]|uniref:Uncharacterized protein n=1 Tax=Cichorium intybus TaxID=13427 RepID=A0ACB9BEY2_CICIN|nr:hypothetical protein L2E82_31512 [Cichorium intybus]